MIRVMGSGGRDEHEWLTPRWRCHTVVRGLPRQWANHVRIRPPMAWILQLRERRDQRKPLADAAVDPLQRRQAEPRPGLVQLGASALEPLLKRALQCPPEGPAKRRPPRPRSEGIGR